MVNFKTNASISDISYHLKKDHIVIVNWWDDIDNDNHDNGHYSLALKYDNKKKLITLADPSQGRGIWDMSIKNFKKRWFDTLDMNNRVYLEGLMIWIDLNSKIE